MEELLLGSVLVVMFVVGMVWLGLRAGLFQGFSEDLKEFQKLPKEILEDTKRIKIFLKKIYDWLL